LSIEYEQRRSERTKDCDRFGGSPVGIRGDADIQRLALLHGGMQSAHRFLEGRIGIEAMVIEDVDVVDAEAAQALIQAREQVLARAEIPVRPGPHVPAGFRRDHQLITVRPEVGAQHSAEVRLRAPVWRTVVIREVERAPQHRALRINRAAVAEVLPEPQ
jgi:hypothetical protein